jgi:hypothetical protein
MNMGSVIVGDLKRRIGMFGVTKENDNDAVLMESDIRNTYLF